ncbi:MAG: hypothetical protein COU63_03085 [Candidatus Pacebacteria bacterium CG10_big_fil_rev_8_21_14_0_10_36_11]|nr:hypothetical protein [Candidatus Pacearchaeota archaeon]OIP74411.1 MAG: hypothetical protein AUK08_01335 [Candidatus Pacebacteria bacterium CG2_30_36_39]PIR64973.1 MAG: hypothetical protein COU63_03085 [Candidatus Pacebacteria bacterium CG10_big_fil_rev_8_21_14_0_10_36_11]PJC42508.1 MAG: hypothetical protein CO040_04120 [Candidatus Pacebacteria bacterium CG_4_9_14_0_2_um_filter_36_8]
MKNQFKKYFVTIVLGFTNPQSYMRWVILPTKHVFRFFAISLFIIGLIRGGLFSYFQLPKLVSSISQATEEVVAQYPEDLVVAWDTKELTLFPTGKYQDLDVDITKLSFLTNEFVKPLNIRYRSSELNPELRNELLNDEETLVVIEKSQYSVLDEENKSLTKQLNSVLPQEEFDVQASDLPYLQKVFNENLVVWQNRIKYLLPIFFGLITILMELFFSLFYGTILWLFAKMAGLLKTWKQGWRLSLAVLVTLNILELVMQQVYQNNPIAIRELGFWAISGFILLSWKFPDFLSGETKSKI